jgi:hypothetical protein
MKKIRWQQGQALPLALVLMSAVAAIAFYMFNTGQLVQEKIALTNTADAVAYSAGIYEARVLNYDAYSNRAFIANEIAIGQAVGLASWAKYVSIAGPRVASVAQFIPYVGSAIASALDLAADEAALILDSNVLALSVMANDLAIQGLKASQYAVHGPDNTLLLANRQILMNEVAHQNDQNADVDLIPVRDDFATFTSRYTTKNERKRMGRVVESERRADHFLKSRNWQFGIFGCYPVGIGFKKRGSTELIDLVDGWKSMDTLSTHSYRLRRFFRCRHSENPIGYGTAFSKNGLTDGAVSYAGSKSTNPRASARANSGSGRAQGFEPATVLKGAIPEFYELSTQAINQAEPITRLTVRVTKSQAKQRYSGGSSDVKPSGSLALYEGDHQHAESASIASVEVYFDRPDGKNRQSNKAELGSLFNPYWQAHLAPVTTAERAQAMLLQGVH